MTISNDDNIDGASTLDLKELTMLRTPMGKSDGLMPTQVQERIMKMPGRKKTKVRSTCSECVILIVEYLIMKIEVKKYNRASFHGNPVFYEKRNNVGEGRRWKFVI